MLNDESISKALRNVCEEIRNGKLEAAEATLDALGFDRLLKPTKNPTKQGGLRLIDPAEDFGADRVHETGEYLQICHGAIVRRDAGAALGSAEKALRRWDQRG